MRPRLRRAAVALGLSLLPCLAALPSRAAEEDAAALIDSARPAVERGDTRTLTKLVQTDRAAAQAAVEKLLAAFAPSDTKVAEALAAAYEQVWRQRTLTDRVALFASWSPDQRAAREAAMRQKEAARTASTEGRQQEALEGYEKALETFRRIGDTRVEARCLLNMAASEALLGESRAALSRLEQASAMAASTGDLVAQVAIAINRGYALEDLGDFAAERTVLTEGLEVARAIDDRSGEATLLLSLTSLALNTADLEVAGTYARETVRLGEETRDPGTSWAAWTNLATLHERLGDDAQSEQDVRRSLEYARQGGLPVEEASAAFNLAKRLMKRGDYDAARVWLGTARRAAAPTDAYNVKGKIEATEAAILIVEGRYEETMPFLEAAEKRFGDTPVPAIQAEFHAIRAHARYYVGDYEGALLWARRSLAGALQASRKDIEASCREGLARLLAVLGDTQGALDEMEKALALYEQLDDAVRRATLLGTIGHLRFNAGDRAGARTSLEQAVSLLDAPGAAPDVRRQLADAMGQLADLDLSGDAAQRAAGMEMLRRAARIFAELEDYRGITLTGVMEADAALKASDLPAARSALSRVAAASRGSRDPEFDWEIRWLEGRVAEAGGDARGARDAYRRSIASVESLRGGLRRPSWRAAVQEDRIAPYRGLVRLLGRQGQVEQAYAVARSAKARTFAESLRASDYDDTYSFHATTGGPGASAMAGADGPAAAVSASRLRERLGADEALVDFFAGQSGEVGQTGPSGDDELQVFVLTRQRIVLRGIPLQKGMVEAFRHPGLPENADAAVTRAWRVAAERLGASLLGPIAGDIAGAGHLLIVPGGPVTGLPFAALSLDSRPLIASRIVSILPAAESLLSRRTPSPRPQAATSAALLALGDPLARDVADRLPAAAEEARVIGRQAAGDGARSETLIGEAARESSLKSKATSFDRIHLAAHGRVDTLAPARSYLALSPGEGQDGRLEAAEISSMRIGASLVVLSGCATGVEGGLAHQDSPGDERIGLARAFLSAGAGNVLADLWEMEDRASLAIMPALYPRLKGRTPAEALAELQRDLIAGRIRDAAGRPLDHPFYWAGLVAYGAGRQP